MSEFDLLGRRRSRPAPRTASWFLSLTLSWLFISFLWSAVLPDAHAAPETWVRLPGHRTLTAASARVVGPESATAPVSLSIALAPRDPQGLAEFARRVSDPADPLYGRYLTPEQFAARFSPTPDQYAQIAAFARSQGLTVTGTSPNRLLLKVAGPAATVEGAFGLHFQRLARPDGTVFRAPDRDPALPASIAPLVTAVAGLDTSLRLRPHLHRQPFQAPRLNLQTSAVPRQIGSGPFGGLTPTDVKVAYSLSGTTLTGAGQTLALFETDGYTASDITAYEDHYGLPHVTLQNVPVDGGFPTPADGAGEVTLDIELQIALAPGVNKILVYEGPNSYGGNGVTPILDIYNQIAVDDQAKQISTSWGLSEIQLGPSEMNAESTIFQEMAAQGQTLYAAAGDDGAYDTGSSTDGVSVDDPASQPYVTGVGGTQLATTGPGGLWQSETTWNDPTDGSGGGGGISVQWPIPTWQQGVVSAAALGSTTMRNVPDVALEADPSTGYSIYFQGGWTIYGGTSCAAPLWAAFTALVNQQRQAAGSPPLGFANPAIYGAANGSNFHDIADHSTNLYYPAVSGYDNATGWGSFNGAALLNTVGVGFYNNPVPAITGVSPSGALVNSGFTLTVTGTGFISGSTLTFGGTPVTVTAQTATTLTASVPAAANATLGRVTVTVTNPAPGGGGASATVTVSPPNPAPAINSVSPSSAPVNTDVPLTVTGVGFIAGSQLYFNGVPLSVTSQSSTSLSATAPAPLLATAGSVTVMVVNPQPGGGTASVPFTITNPAPAITGLTPSSALASTGFTLTVTGTGFVPGSTLTFGGAALAVTGQTPTTLTATVPASANAVAGPVTVAVTNPAPGGGGATATFTATDPAPAISGVSPSVAVTGIGFALTVTGTGFTASSQLSFGGSALTIISRSATQLVAVVPSAANGTAGTVPVTVTNPAPGGGSASGTVSVGNPAPAAGSLTPGSAAAGSGPLALTVSGSGFVPGSTLTFGGAALTVTGQTPTTLTATVPASMLAAAGQATVTVTNPAPRGGSASATFNITNPAPVITRLSPATASAGAAFTLTVTGTGFTPGSALSFGGTPVAITGQTATTLTAAVPAAANAVAGTVPVTVTNASPGGGTASAMVSVGDPVPAITSLSPSGAVVGTGFTMAVTGANFLPSTTVTFGGTALAISSRSATQLFAYVPATANATAGSVPVTVTNPAPGGGAVTATFTASNPAPALISLTPGSAVAGSGPLTLTVTGTNFLPTSTLTFGGAALAVTGRSATTLTAAVPASLTATAGTASVTVTSPSPGGGGSGATFTITAPLNPAPRITAVSPNPVTIGTGFTLTVTGTGFVPASALYFNGTALTITGRSATQLAAAVPAAANAMVGSASVVVVTPAPGGGAAAATLGVARAATVSLTASPSPAALGQTVTLTATVTGSARTGVPTGTVLFQNGGVALSGAVRLNASGVATVTTSALPAGSDALTAVYSGDANYAPGTSPAVTEAVKSPVPTIKSLSPSTVSAGAGFTLTVTGTGFGNGTTLTVGGAAVTVTGRSATTLTATVPASAVARAGSVRVAVTNPAPGGGSASATLTVH